MYNAQNVAFLLDPKDSVQAYEEAGKMNKKESQYEKGMKALASLEHVQQLTAIEGKIIKLKIFCYACSFGRFNFMNNEDALVLCLFTNMELFAKIFRI